MVESHARALRAEARRTDQRRLLVLAGERDQGLAATEAALGAVVDEGDAVTVVSSREHPVETAGERVDPDRAADLLGTTRDTVVLDCHAGFSPNRLGQVVGAVRGGGLLVLVTPPLADWPRRRGRFDEGLAAPPADLSAVTGHFRRRLVRTLRSHPGVSVLDVGASGEATVAVDGRTGASEPPARGRVPDPPAGAPFPAAAYEACLTADQHRAVRVLGSLATGGAVVVEADRGRGKSAAAGLAAGSLAADGREVLVTAPARRGVAALFERARALLETEGALAEETEARGDDDRPRTDLQTTTGGRVRFVDAADLDESACAAADAVVVDEAAGLPVDRLEATLAAPAVAYVTTVHGYEGAGRGFAVRFRDRLAESGHDTREVELSEPVRHAPDDPVEAWAFDALLLDARPAVAEAVDDATPETAAYEAFEPAALVEDETRLRETFGLLALAHYRTEPDDLARLLDAPNVRTRALVHEGRVVAVALLAREGGLDADTRRRAYEGERIRGNMLPDVLTSQLRDEEAGAPVGDRVLRIAVHGAVRSRGLGSALLGEVAASADDEVDWLGVGYGATPRLLRFWAANGYRTVHVSTTRNARSGEYSALMLRPTSAAGDDLAERHGTWFVERAPDVLSDALGDLETEVARLALRAADATVDVDLSAHDWRVVAAAAFGPGLYDAAPGAFARLALAALVEGGTGLDASEERLLVAKALQHRPWAAVATEQGYVSERAAMRAFGEAFRPLVDRYGGTAAEREADRYR
ncbi:MAG: tRNA(Met) cytidine acetyltransferase TmcA [Haloferacaceae archaeon]